MKRLTALCLLLLGVGFAPAVLPVTQYQPPAKSVQKQEQPAAERGLGYLVTPEKRAAYYKLSKARHGDRIKRAAAFMALPSKFNCFDKVPLLVRDQGGCGSCYLCSTVWYSFTGAAIWSGYGKVDGLLMSAQFGMDRPRNFGGCGGGWGAEVAEWACKNGWVAEYWTEPNGTVHKDYPAYRASSGSDQTASGAKVWVKGWTWGFVSHSGEGSKWTIDEFKAAMNLYGFINVSLDAGGQFSNGAGTITALGRNINHEIGAGAYDDDMVNPDGTKGAILLVNQWGKGWGNQGMRWITYKAALAGIVDPFWVSAGGSPTPPDPIPVPGGTPPFKLYQGVVPDLTQVGDKSGYATLPGAEAAAKTVANSSGKDVLVYDSAKPSVLVETVKPGGPTPPPDGKTITLELTPDQVMKLLKQLDAKTREQIKKALEKAFEGGETEEPPLPPAAVLNRLPRYNPVYTGDLDATRRLWNYNILNATPRP